MIKNRLLTILSALICWLGLSASENLQIVNLFEGDSLAQLSKEQIETLDFAINLLEENDSVVILPQEVNLLIGDTTKVLYISYPDWHSAYFMKDGKNKKIVVPTYAKTPLGIISSQVIIKNKKQDKYECIVITKISTCANMLAFTGTYMESNIQGVFLKGKMFNNGSIVGEIEGEKQNKVAIYCKGNYHKKYTTQELETLQIFKSDRTEQWIPEKNGIIKQWFE